MGLFILSCGKVNETIETTTFSDADRGIQTNQTNETFYRLLKQHYLWNNEIEQLNPSLFLNASSLLEAIRHEDDSFSYIGSKKVLSNYYQNAAYQGFGLVLKKKDQHLYVSISFPNCSSGQAGLVRGNHILTLNGASASEIHDEELHALLTDSDTLTIRYLDTQAVEKEVVLSTSTCQIESAFGEKIIEHNGEKIGYFVYHSFIDSVFEKDVLPIMAYFQANHITKLIVDTRYNVGGEISALTKLLNILAGNSYAGQLQFQLHFNQDQQHNNRQYIFSSSSHGLNISDIAFLNTNITASSAELLQVSLDTYLNTTKIGQPTYGKPVGMNAWTFSNSDDVLVSVTFKNKNATGYSDYYEGLTPDITVTDDPQYAFGDSHCPMVSAGLASLTGTSTYSINAKALINSSQIGMKKMFQELKYLY